MSVLCSAPLSLVIGFEMTSSFLPGLIPINRTTSRTPMDGEELARFVCGCWLLARSFLSFFSCFQFVRNFLRLSRLPLIAPCFQESRDDGHLLISGWLLISNHEPLLDCFPPFGRIALRHAPWARKWTRRKHWVHLLRWSWLVTYRIYIFF